MTKKAKVDHSKQRNLYSPNKVHISNMLDVDPDALINTAVKRGTLDPAILTQDEQTGKMEVITPPQEITADDYNQKLFDEGSKEVEHLTILGNKVMIRLLKGQNKADSGLYIARSGIYTNPETGKSKIDMIDDDSSIKAFLNQGLVVGIGTSVSGDFRNNVEIGDIVEIPVSLYKTIYQYIAPRNFLSLNVKGASDNYYIIPESHISAAWKRTI